jgi:hypothetical protein
VWGDFDKEKIVSDFYQTMDHPVLVKIGDQ